MLAPLVLLMARQAPGNESDPLARMAAVMKGHKAVSFTLVGGLMGHEATDQVRFLAPDLFSVVSKLLESHSDGTQVWFVDHTNRTSSKRLVKDELRVIGVIPGLSLVFPDAQKIRATGASRNEEFLGKRVIAVPYTYTDNPQADMTYTLLLDPVTALPIGMHGERNGKPNGTFRFRNVVLDPPLTPADFTYAPPAAYRDVTRPNFP